MALLPVRPGGGGPHPPAIGSRSRGVHRFTYLLNSIAGLSSANMQATFLGLHLPTTSVRRGSPHHGDGSCKAHLMLGHELVMQGL